MQKKLLAVAVAGACGAPAIGLAQTSTVQIFGTVYVEYSYYHQGQSTTPGVNLNSVDFIQTPGSEIGFKGEEKLGGGLSAWFQCASTADPRGLSKDGWCSRNSALGFKGGFGNFFIGNWDAPFKRTSGPWSVGSNETGIWGSSFLLTGGSTTTDNPPTGAAVARGTFKRRQNSLITYDSPNFGGFMVMAAFSAAQNATGTLSNASNNKARIVSIGGQYSAGPLFIGAGYERHIEYNSVGATAAVANGRDGDDTGWHVGGAYTWGPVRFGGGYTQQKFELGTTALPTESKVKAWHVGVDWRIVGPHGLRASYTKAGDMKGTPGAVAIAGNGATRPAVPALGAPNDTGANLWTIRYVYTFSKRTEFNLGYARLDNDGNTITGGAQYTIGGGTSPGLHAMGATQYAFGASVRHSW